jgi:hypothetical protein
MAAAIAKSGLFGIKTQDQALALMAVAQAEGLHPASVARDYHVIQGRPALKADAMLARFIQAGGRVTWDAYTDDCVKATFSHPAGGTVTVDWTMERAKRAGLGTKDNWRSYPRQMLRSRVISEGIRTVYPGVSVGVYTVEEAEDEPPKPDGIILNPRPEDMKPMDPEHCDQYAESLKPLLSLDQSAMPKPEAARTCLKVLDLWGELTQDEQIQVFDRFNTKEKSRLRKISALDSAMLKATAEALEGETTEVVA